MAAGVTDDARALNQPRPALRCPPHFLKLLACRFARGGRDLSGADGVVTADGMECEFSQHTLPT